MHEAKGSARTASLRGGQQLARAAVGEGDGNEANVTKRGLRVLHRFSQSFADHAELALSSAWGENMLEGVSNRGKKNRRMELVILAAWLVSVGSFGRAGLSVTPETTARQAPQSTGLPRRSSRGSSRPRVRSPVSSPAGRL